MGIHQDSEALYNKSPIHTSLVSHTPLKVFEGCGSQDKLFVCWILWAWCNFGYVVSRCLLFRGNFILKSHIGIPSLLQVGGNPI